MQKSISEQLGEFLQKHNMELAYNDAIHNAELIEAIKYFHKDKSVDEQEFTIHALNSYALKFKKTIKNWSDDPLTEWLKEMKIQYRQLESETKRHDKAAHKQQILILHYLGLLDKIDVLPLTQEKRADLLSYILNRNSKNTKTYLSTIKGRIDYEDPGFAKTPNNLDFVEKLFRDFELEEIVQKIQEDKRRINLD